MARTAVMSKYTKKHLTNGEKAARAAAEEMWRKGAIADYEPSALTESGMDVFAALVDAIPEAALAKIDGYTIEVAADAIDKMRECRESIDRDGLIIETVNGNGIKVRKQNEMLLAYQKYSEIAKKYLVELGLTPQARSKIAIDAAARASKPATVFDMLDDENDEV